MSGRLKKILWLLPIPILLVGLTTVPSGGWKMYNASRQVVIEFFDTGDAEFDGDVTAAAFIGDGSGLTGVSGGTGHAIKDEGGAALTTRANLNFVGPTVTATDNAGTSATDVTINAVAGPSSSVDNTLPRYDSTTGKIIQTSGVVVDDSNNVSGIAALTVTSLDLTTLLDVVEGGTGVGTFTDAGVLIGNGTGDIQVTGAGTSGQVLTSNGAGVDPTFQSFPGGGDALTTNPLSQFANTTSAQLAGIITNETGTGLLVYGTSPTLTTPNLGTPSAAVLTNATGLPVAGGGTGAATFTDAGVLIGNSTGAVQVTGAGTAGQVLTSNGTGVDPTFQTITGTGDVDGPGSATDNALSRFDGTTGKIIQNSSATLDDSGNLTATSFIGDGSALTGISGTGDVDGPASSTDNAITRFDSTTGKLVQNSGVIIDDSNNISGVGTLDLGTPLAVAEGGSGAGTYTDGGVIIGNGTSALQATSAGTSGQVLTSNGAGVDPTFQTAASGGDPTFGSEAAATDDAVFVDENNWLGLGITNPLGPLHIYSETAAPRTYYQYFNDDAGDVTQYPTSAATVDDADATTPVWSNPTNSFSDNGTDTTVVRIGAPTVYSEALITYAYGYAIPDGATILGVEVEVEGSMSDADATEGHAYLIRGGTIDTGEDRSTAANWSGSMTTHTFGGPTDDWGGITEDEVNASGFGFAFQARFTSSANVNVDYIRITVYYASGTPGDYTWSSGTDISDGAFTLRANATDQMRMDYTTGDAEFTGDVTAAAFIGDGSGLTGLPSAGIADPGTSTDRAILTWNGTTGDAVRDNTVGIDSSGNVTLASGDTVDGRDVSVDGTKLDGIASGATANTGTVTSVTITGSDGIDIDSGSPITGSGTIQLGLDSPALHWNMMTAGSTVTPTTSDSLLISDQSNSGVVADILLSNLFITTTGNDNYLYKKNGSTGQFDLTGLLVDDSNNITGAGTVNGYTVPGGTGTFASIAGAQILTNKDIQARELVTNTSISVDAGLYDRVVLTGTSSSPLAVNAPTGTFVNGKQLELAINQHGSSAFVLNFNAVFKSGADWALSGAIPAISTTLDAWDYYLFEWNSYESEWHLLACSQGN